MDSKKRILVIGGGLGGIAAVRNLKEEGFQPVCYEKTSDWGGTWRYNEAAPEGMPSIMPTTTINISKEMCALSDYVPDKKLSNYMRHKEVLQMVTGFAEKHDCFRHVTYNRAVLKIIRSADYDETGRWDADIKNTVTGEISHEVYDGVVVCVGHITHPKMPSYPGMEKFQGKIMHTHDLKGVDKFKDKKVVIIGFGISAIDAAVDTSSVASQVYLSTRSGGWLLPKVGPYGYPFDIVFLRRWILFFKTLFGHRFLGTILQIILNSNFDHDMYNLRPDFNFFCKDPIMNDALPNKLITGSVLMKRDVQCFTENGVIFENETKVTEADVVIMGTGYTWKFPFLEKDIVKVEDGRINLYQCMYPPQLKHPSLVIVGFALPNGPGFPLGEMQLRWATQVFKGNCKLPSEMEMMKEVTERHEKNVKRYSPSEKMSLRIDYIDYMDNMASMFGVKPNLWLLLFTDPRLFLALLFGPFLPYQYRLVGPHKWGGARDAILTVYDRVRYPFYGYERKKQKQQVNPSFKYILLFLMIAVFFFFGR